MKKLFLTLGLLVFIAIFGLNPFADKRNTAGIIDAGYSGFDTAVERQSNGIYRVRALTRMPKVTPDMVRWWFTDYLQTTEHYKWWHPTAHVWMDWENKTPGEIVGASHLVHEYIGDELNKLRIHFVDHREVLGDVAIPDDSFMLCARVGMLDQPINIAKMCHYVRSTPWGAEMRSTFWLGDIGVRDNEDENQLTASPITWAGNTAIARLFAVNEQTAIDLMTHAIEEMGYLSDFLPELYNREAGN